MNYDKVLEIVGYGAWNGGEVVDNSIFENRGLTFKGDIPVNAKTIEERIGVRTRVVAPAEERIGVLALQNLLQTSEIDRSKIKVLIGATNVGEDLYDPGPLVRYPYQRIQAACPDALVFDLYAGCPGFNVSVELIFMLSLTGVLREGDLSIIVGAENPHRAEVFRPSDTANIIFGDDALATALETKATITPQGSYACAGERCLQIEDDPAGEIAEQIFDLTEGYPPDGIICDNQTGNITYRIPALAARIQHRLVELMYSDQAADGTFRNFKSALSFYDKHVRSFAFDIMNLNDASLIETIAEAYVSSGRFKRVVAVSVGPDLQAKIRVHTGRLFSRVIPAKGIVDTLTRAHGCFADYIHAVSEDDQFYGKMNGKGVFLYATRGAKAHLSDLLSQNKLTPENLDLLIEHQANFAMIPLTLEQVLNDGNPADPALVADFIHNKMVTNIHLRGNSSVVCMQRLPYDLQRGALREDVIHGYQVNGNLKRLKNAKTVLNDSVGAGMIRSSFLQQL